MSTNFYLEGEPCKHCKRGSDAGYHIGKRSVGWSFALHIEPELGINNLEDVLDTIKDKTIVDEYGNAVSYDRMLHIIKEPCLSKEQKAGITPSSGELYEAINRGYFYDDRFNCWKHTSTDLSYSLIEGEFC